MEMSGSCFSNSEPMDSDNDYTVVEGKRLKRKYRKTTKDGRSSTQRIAEADARDNRPFGQAASRPRQGAEATPPRERWGVGNVPRAKFGGKPSSCALACCDSPLGTSGTARTALRAEFGGRPLRYALVDSKSPLGSSDTHEELFTDQPGCTDLASHTIETGDALPLKCNPRPVSLAKRQVIDGLLDEMLSADIIRRSYSAWASPIVLVPKKDGSHRLCVDYRRLNGVTPFIMDKTVFLITALVAISAATVVLWLLKRRHRHKFFKDLGIPGPKPDFLWGNLKQMDHRRIEALVQWKKEHGNLFGVYVGSEPFLVITDPQMAHECLVKQAAIFQDRPTSFVDAEPFKSSLFQLGGSKWKNVRTALNYAFSSNRVKDLSAVADFSATRFVEKISSISLRSGQVEVFDRALDFAFDFTMNTVKSQQGCNEPILEFLKQVSKDMENSAIEVAFTVPVIRAVLTLIYPFTKHARAFKNIMSNVQHIIELRRSGELPKEPSVLQTLLGTEALDVAQKKRSRLNKYLNDQDISSNAAIFLLAGTEVTASALSFLMYLLARHPSEQEKVFKEMEDIFPSEEGIKLNFGELHRLKRIDMVIYEGLRLYPPIPLYLIRSCCLDTTVSGQCIPAGVNVMVTPWLIHQDPEIWPEPEKFLPDRFAEENSESRQNGIYMPFGLGPRVCIDQKLGFLAVKSALVKVVREFRLTLCDEAAGPPTLSVPSVILIPGGGVKVRLEPRTPIASSERCKTGNRMFVAA
ncbi:cytochrome P450 3A24-like [Dermacentor albipictus]|uniref:cytochrome P450 3A24-like n=1 Tax=Dermacentor albipictus TaxID=60249 RepID=UPI0038FCEDF7